MATIDEIRLGPLRLQLHETAEGHVVVVNTQSSNIGGGAATTLEEWRKVKRFVGLEGVMDMPPPLIEPVNLRKPCECYCGGNDDDCLEQK
jgi:hypothetical protein